MGVSSFLRRLGLCDRGESRHQTMRISKVAKGAGSAEQMRGDDLINNMLLDEALMEIMAKLSGKNSDRNSCALVCRRWRRVERASRSYIGIGSSANPDNCISSLLLRFTDLRHVHIDERLPPPLAHARAVLLPQRNGQERRRTLPETGETLNKLTDRGLGLLGRGCPRLEKLCLSWCSAVTGSGLVSVAENCKFLKTLDLQGHSVGDDILEAVGHSCKQLEDLSLQFSIGLTDEGLVAIAKGCGKTLKALHVRGCVKVKDSILTVIGSNFPLLETLSLKLHYMANDGVLAIAKGCLRLKELRLTFDMATLEALQALANNFFSMETLALYNRYCPRGSYSRSLPIRNVCQKLLKSLTLTRCDFLGDQNLTNIANGCTELTRLEINGCCHIETAGLVAIGRSCRALKELILEDCRNIGNDGLVEIGMGCPQLESLQLDDCPRIGNSAICSIAMGCRNLRRLHVCQCHKVEDGSIVTIAENCKKLTDLRLQFSNSIGDKALAAIGHGCKFLKHLDIRCCLQVGDSGISAIARGCHQLDYLDICASKTSDAGLGFLVNNCKRLEVCKILYCHLVTEVGVAAVVAGCPGIKKIVVEAWKVKEGTIPQALAELLDELD